MLASRELSGGSIRFVINAGALGAVFESNGTRFDIAATNINYVPSALVEHLLPANKDKLAQEALAQKNAAVAKFLREHPVKLVLDDAKGYSLHFEYSQATYYSQIALSLAMAGGSFATGGIAAPLLFAFGAGTLMYSVFQPCQDLDWSSFVLEGSVGAVTTVATMGLGSAAQGVRTWIKAVESPLGRQALHFGVNGAAALGGRVVGAGAKAGAKVVTTGEASDEFKDFTGKSIVSTVVSAGLGGFAGAVAGKASALASALDVSRVDAIKKAGTHGLAAGAVAGAVGSGSVDIAWGLASGGDLSAKDVALAAVQGAMTGATAGAVAGERMAARTYDNLSLAKTEAEVKAKAGAEEPRGAGDRSALAIEADIQKQIKDQNEIKKKIAASNLPAESAALDKERVGVGKSSEALVKKDADLIKRQKVYGSMIERYKAAYKEYERKMLIHNRTPPKNRSWHVYNSLNQERATLSSEWGKLVSEKKGLEVLRGKITEETKRHVQLQKALEQKGTAFQAKAAQVLGLHKALEAGAKKIIGLKSEAEKLATREGIELVKKVGEAIQFGLEEFSVYNFERSVKKIMGAIAGKIVNLGGNVVAILSSEPLGTDDLIHPEGLYVLPFLDNRRNFSVPPPSGPSIGPRGR